VFSAVVELDARSGDQVLDCARDEDLESLGMKGSAVRIRASDLTKDMQDPTTRSTALVSPFAYLLSFGTSAIQGRSTWRLCRVLVRLGQIVGVGRSTRVIAIRL